MTVHVYIYIPDIIVGDTTENIASPTPVKARSIINAQ